MFYLITLTQQIDAVRILYVIYRESASNLCLDLSYRERGGQIVDDNFYIEQFIASVYISIFGRIFISCYLFDWNINDVKKKKKKF